jgi:hypothetical protein
MDQQSQNDDVVTLIDSVLALPISHASSDELREYSAQIQRGVIQTDDKDYVIALCKRLLRQGQNKVTDQDRDKRADQNQVIIRTYTGSQVETMGLFQADSIGMAAEGYFPTSQSWAPGQWGSRAFVVAFLLCFLFVGFVALIYMLIVKPDGTLTVTYERRTASFEEKTCPMCAERIKAAALVCHFCGHKFAPGEFAGQRAEQRGA